LGIVGHEKQQGHKIAESFAQANLRPIDENRRRAASEKNSGTEMKRRGKKRQTFRKEKQDFLKRNVGPAEAHYRKG